MSEKELTIEELKAYLNTVENWLGHYDDLKENLRAEIAKREAKK